MAANSEESDEPMDPFIPIIKYRGPTNIHECPLMFRIRKQNGIIPKYLMEKVKQELTTTVPEIIVRRPPDGTMIIGSLNINEMLSIFSSANQKKITKHISNKISLSLDLGENAMGLWVGNLPEAPRDSLLEDLRRLFAGWEASFLEPTVHLDEIRGEAFVVIDFSEEPMFRVDGKPMTEEAEMKEVMRSQLKYFESKYRSERVHIGGEQRVLLVRVITRPFACLWMNRREDEEARDEDAIKATRKALKDRCAMELKMSVLEGSIGLYFIYKRTVSEKFFKDAEVLLAMRDNFRRLGRGSLTPTSATLSRSDMQAIRVRNFKNGVNRKNKVIDLTVAEVPSSLPLRSPSTYELLGEKRDGPFNIPVMSMCKTHRNASPYDRITSLPFYLPIDSNRRRIGKKDDAIRRRAKKIRCACTCEDECIPGSCPCMKDSAMGKDGRVTWKESQEQYLVMCGDRCACRNHSQPCISVPKFINPKVHIIREESGIGCGLRTLEPIQRGDVLFEMTGEYASTPTQEEGYWSVVVMEGGNPYFTPITGIEEHENDMYLVTSSMGNIARFICHSFDENVQFIRAYTDGMSSSEPRVFIFAVEPIEAGEILYVNYGDDFGITRENCLCTRDLCHNKDMIKWMKKMTRDQMYDFVKVREIEKRQRMVEQEKYVHEDAWLDLAYRTQTGKDRSTRVIIKMEEWPEELEEEEEEEEEEEIKEEEEEEKEKEKEKEKEEEEEQVLFAPPEKKPKKEEPDDDYEK